MNENNEIFVKFKSSKDKYEKAIIERLREECGRGSLRVSPVPDETTRNLSPGKMVSVHGKLRIIEVNAALLVKA